ncbi:hypothetical protein CFIMG_006583RA [Ceratocystis fimbriata CBS 114723]|uniref:PNPLA domain-containing protein n=1 Tax=Ceratocystis fimbriata CBS 114723 TaxID=1035309 RepID=A0A2C5WUM6_9PEZI|nr:hypothetical protein CFIMG_006583RA [Ceratocystis fimbriata CBS 114723]
MASKVEVAPPPIKILTLDGGGVRGLSSLLILEKVMEIMKSCNGVSTVYKPCDVFDLIGGSGTGGIIAILLGRLRMSVDDSITAYKEIMTEAFVENLWEKKQPLSKFSAKNLQKQIQETIRQYCPESECVQRRKSNNDEGVQQCSHVNALYSDESSTKTVVLAMTKVNLDTVPTFLATHHTAKAFSKCKIWEVARATSAAVEFFDSIKIGRDEIEFIDAGFGYSNPCEVLIEQATSIFPNREIRITSIGTGLGDVIQIQDTKKSVIEALRKMAASSKAVDLRLRSKYPNTRGQDRQYYRLNVANGLEDTTISDCGKTSNISAHTMNYFSEKKLIVNELADMLGKDLKIGS